MKNNILREYIKILVEEAMFDTPQQSSLVIESVFNWIKKALRAKKDKKHTYPKTSQVKNQDVARAARALSASLDKLSYEDELDAEIYYEFLKPLLRKIERKYGSSSSLSSLYEEGQQGIAGGPEPIRIGAAYLEKEAIMKRVQEVILDKAPNGTQSQAHFLDMLDQAIDQVHNELSNECGEQDVDRMSDYELTLGMVKRVLSGVPHQVFFQALNI